MFQSKDFVDVGLPCIDDNDNVVFEKIDYRCWFCKGGTEWGDAEESGAEGEVVWEGCVGWEIWSAQAMRTCYACRAFSGHFVCRSGKRIER